MVRIHFPNSGHLQNFAGMARHIDMSDSAKLHFSMHPRYVSVHPVALAMAASAGALVRENGGEMACELSESGGALRYLARMGLFNFIEAEPGISVREHEAAGRFIPLTQIRSSDELSRFIVDMVPLLHASPEEAGPIKYVISELVRNVIEHAASPVGALVCAQYFGHTQRLSVGVADVGVGIRRTMSRFHVVPTDLDALHEAMRPGVSGTSPRYGGTEFNAGAGLFFIKSIARVSKNFFVLYSGEAMFKLLKSDPRGQNVLFADPRHDRATRETELPSWQGTVIGIDVSVKTHSTFKALLRAIGEAYDVDVKQSRKKKFKKARFE